MKLKSTLILSTLLIIISFETAFPATAITAKTDQRIELLSIVFRLAGNEEYNMNQFKAYVDDIDKWFAPYKNHPVIAYAKQLRVTRGVSFDAVMSMAIHLGQPPALEPLISLKSSSLDHRWGKSGATRFLKLLRDFYEVSGFSQFYSNHQQMYTIAETRMDAVLAKVNFGWFEQFYGVKSGGRFNLVIGIGNGGGNYGPKVIFPDGSEDLYAIMGTWMVDKDGNPNFNDNILNTIIHEFNHSFANPLVEKFAQVLEAPGKALFAAVKDQMTKMAYGNWKTVMYESLVRAASIQYFIDSKVSEKLVRRMTITEISNGFYWTGRLVDLLRDYQSSRDKYPALSDFMPVVASFYTKTAPDVDALKSDFLAHCAHVEAIEPDINGALAVDPALTEIRIRFDKPLNPKSGYSINYGDQGAEHFPLDGKPKYGDDGLYLIVNVKIKPDWDYSFNLTPMAFRTPDDYPLANYRVKFHTRKSDK